MITKSERKQVEKAAKKLYQDVIKVDIKEDPENESSLLVTVIRGTRMPVLKLDRDSMEVRK